MANSMPDINIGDRVRCGGSGKLLGTIRFKGETRFAPGEWFGVELDAVGQGKNDGSVQGVEYFRCVPMQGIFVRRSALALESTAAEAGTARPAAPQRRNEGAAPRASGTNLDLRPGAEYPRDWKRRHSIDPDLNQAIEINGQAAMVEAIRSCSTEVHKLHGVVRRLSAALDDAAARESAALEAADASQVPEPAADDLEQWLSAATSRIERRIEERLGASLEKQVVSAIASPIAELKAAAAEMHSGRDK
mmetsp:Transcript_104999/g.185971  ORF Transcript_104999/g.185971 Transcript_104999/m.185971 type:complete len:248 (-) Transcript_104999:160-903(-)